MPGRQLSEFRFIQLNVFGCVDVDAQCRRDWCSPLEKHSNQSRIKIGSRSGDVALTAVQNLTAYEIL